jgi:Spy/CpxP family protein refolding chaperone
MMNNRTMRIGLGLLIGGLALGASPAASYAQDAAKQKDGAAAREARGGRGAGGRMNPTTAVERLQAQVNELKLTDEQKPKLAEIFKSASTDAKALEKDLEGTQGRERMQKMQPFLQGLREKVTGVLDDAQKAELREKMPARRRGGPGAPGGGGGGGGGGAFGGEMFRENLKDLDLTAEQQTKVDALLDESRAKMQALRGEAGGAGAGNTEGREKMRAALRETREKLDEILTPDQRTKLREKMAARRSEGGAGGGGRGPRGGPNRPNRVQADPPTPL